MFVAVCQVTGLLNLLALAIRLKSFDKAYPLSLPGTGVQDVQVPAGSNAYFRLSGLHYHWILIHK